ncbi:type II toxin-antitoxin system HicB family antitoxin [Candidatus Peregrinibacteria bacterium]|nr:type II toxin-antitoxin system HicB family antitoxin [Candidatus Peregrinibacteria bacterium]
MLKLVIWKEGDKYVAWCLNNGVSSFGNTKNDAIESLKEALHLYFEDVPLENVTKVERPAIESFSFKYA